VIGEVGIECNIGCHMETLAWTAAHCTPSKGRSASAQTGRPCACATL
jgi:hypothetical protein